MPRIATNNLTSKITEKILALKSSHTGFEVENIGSMQELAAGPLEMFKDRKFLNFILFKIGFCAHKKLLVPQCARHFTQSGF